MPVCRFVATRTKLPQPSLWKLWSSIGGGSSRRDGIGIGLPQYQWESTASTSWRRSFWLRSGMATPTPSTPGQFCSPSCLCCFPPGLGVWLTHTCTAWNGTREGRCARACYGLRRCGTPEHSRSAQPLTLPEGVALLSWGVAVLNIWIFLSAAL